MTQDITDDPDRNTVLIVTGEVKGFKDYRTSVNLHDFNTVNFAIYNHFFSLFNTKMSNRTFFFVISLERRVVENILLVAYFQTDYAFIMIVSYKCTNKCIF